MADFTGKDKYDDYLIEKLEIHFPITNLIHHLTYQRLRMLLIDFQQWEQIRNDKERNNNNLLQR